MFLIVILIINNCQELLNVEIANEIKEIPFTYQSEIVKRSVNVRKAGMLKNHRAETNLSKSCKSFSVVL
jgi:hypothetical protein